MMPPEGPQGFKEFALGVEPRMGGGAAVAEGKLIKVPDRAGTAFGGLEEGAIGDGLQNREALAVELFKAQRFAIAGLVVDGQAAVAGQAGELFEAGRVLHEGDKEMGANDANTRDGAKVLDFREGAAGLEHQAAGLLLGQEGGPSDHRAVRLAGVTGREAIAQASVGDRLGRRRRRRWGRGPNVGRGI